MLSLHIAQVMKSRVFIVFLELPNGKFPSAAIYLRTIEVLFVERLFFRVERKIKKLGMFLLYIQIKEIEIQFLCCYAFFFYTLTYS